MPVIELKSDGPDSDMVFSHMCYPNDVRLRNEYIATGLSWAFENLKKSRVEY